MRHLVTIAALGAATAAAAQSVPRPPAAPAQPFHFPRVQSHVLPNGLRVLTVEDHSVQVVAVRAVLGVDDSFDPPGKEGIYQVLLGALREGTKTRTAAQLAEVSARIGTAVAPTAFSTVPSEFEPALALMGDMLMNPSFDQAGIDRRKAAQAARARTALGIPAAPARNAWYALTNGRGDAITRGYYATEAGVNSITRDDVVAFYDRAVGPKATTLVIVGDVTDAAAVAAATRVFGGWRGGATGERTVEATAPAQRPTTVYLVDAVGTNSYIEMGTAGPQRGASDAAAAELLGTITTNRMLQALREKRSLVYAGSMVMVWHPMPRRAEFLGATSVAPVKVDSALAEWLSTLRALRAAPPTQQEIDDAKRARVGPLLMRIDGPDSVANRVTEAVRDGLPPNFLEQYASGIEGVAPSDVAAAASKYLDLDHLVIVVSGDRKLLEPALRAANVGPVVVIDLNGKPIP